MIDHRLQPVTLLVIDGSESDRVTYSRYLQSDTEKTYRIIEAKTLAEGLDLWRSLPPDIVLIDLNLPDGDGLEFLEAINDHAGEKVPVIMLTGQGDEEMAVNAMQLGAADYLVKGDITPKLLTIAVRQVLQEALLNRQLQRSQQQQILIAEIALRIREFMDLDDISRAIVREVRQFIKTDRAIIYQFNPDMSGTVVAEDIVSPWLPCLNEQIEDTCFRDNLGGAYCEGRIYVANDIYAANLTTCHLQLLERFQVRANLVVPILLPNENKRILWGLLILHQCSAPRVWLESDIQLLQQIAVQIAISIKQAIAHQQVQTELAERQRVEVLLLHHQAELEDRNQLLEKISKELQCTVEELKEITDEQIEQYRLVQYEQNRYQNLFDFAPDGYLVTDLAGRISEANQAILELLAIRHEFVLSKPLAIFVAPSHRDSFYSQLEYQSSSGYVKTTWEITLINRQGGTFPAEITVTRNTNLTDYEPQLFWMIRDISDRKRNERALQQLNQFLEAKVRDRTKELWEVNQLLQTVLDAFPLAVFWKDRQSVILGCNQLFAITSGMDSPLEAIGKSDFDFACTPDEALAYITEDQQIMKSGLAKLNIEEKITLVSGEQQWIQTNKIPLRDVEGNVIGVLGTFQDISDRKEAEIQLQKANQELLRATKLKDEFLANMSHELRTPLNSILGLSESLKDEILGSMNEKQLRAITVVESSGEHLLSLINDILDLSKISSGMVELDIISVSVKNLCDSSLVFVKQQAFNKKIQIYSHIPTHINNINIDERRIKQVLINLLTNAVKFTPNEGNIKLLVAIGSGDTWQGEATIPQQLRDKNSPTILFQVVDTGIGIAAKDLQILFQPFIQVDSALNRQYEGTGLGLALVKQLVELHSGQVMVESVLGQGSCFTFALPYEMSPSNTISNAIASISNSTISSSMEIASDNAPLTPLILLAEDNEANIQTFSSYLTAIKYRVIIARNGLEAVAQAKANLPDVILMDIQMPTMDGLEATKQIRLDPNLVNIPIITLTALAMEGDREKCLDAGANEYLAKPIRLRQLHTTIQQFLGQN